MFKLKHLLLTGLFLSNAGLAQPAEPENSKLKIDFWLSQYRRVTHLQECKEAHEVFETLLKVADKPVGVLPKLFIFENLAFGKTLALPDGSIILPFDVIKFCFKNPAYGKARLAFVLGHELKHIVRGDYAILRILKFDTTFPSASYSTQLRLFWKSMETQQQKTFETEADEFAILYAALAGYDTDAIVSSTNNFISEYYGACGINMHGDAANNPVAERLNALNRRLNDISSHLDLFNFGVRLYAIGKYDAAIELLEKFVTQFPSREVFNNLGLCYYQKALAHYAEWKHETAGNDPHLIYRVSMAIDPVPRLRNRSLDQHAFHEMIAHAIKNFEEAKAKDANYETGLNNLGCAHLLKGEVDFAKGHFKKTLELKQNYHEAHNNLGVASVVEGRVSDAFENFKNALKLKPDYPESIYNLGRLSYQLGQTGAAKTYFKKYLQVDSASAYANIVRELLGQKIPTSPSPNFVESIDLPHPATEQSNRIDTPAMEMFKFHDWRKQLDYFQFVAKATGEKIALRRAAEGHKGVSAKGIGIGASEKLVSEKYPYPHSIKATTTGALRVYADLNLVFEIRDGKVRAWYLYSAM